MSAAPPPSLIHIVAIADNGAIGCNGALPFRQSADLRRFKALTWGKPVLMGRKTYASIGRPLPGRTNIVVTRDRSFAAPGVAAVHDLDTALALARADALRRGAGEIVVIGGTEIFAATTPLAERLEVTHVHARPDGDVFYPPIDPAVWRETARSDHPAGPRDEAPFSHVTYVRRNETRP